MPGRASCPDPFCRRVRIFGKALVEFDTEPDVYGMTVAFALLVVLFDISAMIDSRWDSRGFAINN